MPTLTVEQSKLGARRSAEARKANALELQALRARVKEFEAALPAKPFVQPSEDYVADRLVRVRKQLDRLDSMLMEEQDPQKLDRLVSATSRLEEQERKLSGRFAPGTTKPSSKPAQARHSTVQPIGPAPQQAVVPPTEPQASLASHCGATKRTNDN